MRLFQLYSDIVLTGHQQIFKRMHKTIKTVGNL